jgi:hypothetical protein
VSLASLAGVICAMILLQSAASEPPIRGIPPLNAFEREARMRFFGDCTGVVDFAPGTKVVTVRVTFDAETTHPEEQQRQGWQAISNNLAKHMVAKDMAAK